MKKAATNQVFHILMIVFFLTAILLVMTACIDKNIKDGTKTETVEPEAGINDDTCFNIEDFSCIVVGQSTFQDVYEITSCGGLVSSACGGAAEYPTENGYVRIEFSGSDLVVVRLEEKTGTSRVWEHIKKID